NRTTVETRDLNTQRTNALVSRSVIEQAKGMIAERQSIQVDEALDRLRRHARNHNLRLAALARDTVAGAIEPATTFSRWTNDLAPGHLEEGPRGPRPRRIGWPSAHSPGPGRVLSGSHCVALIPGGLSRGAGS
ncbi:ANTAR domain-containing protein, partial [Raoultella terrigena]|uniref:ANTAR domain-containing protein n=1 Tax=Raoultella terrigena TaxID=577 RepID=UPI00132F7C9E